MVQLPILKAPFEAVCNNARQVGELLKSIYHPVSQQQERKTVIEEKEP